MFIVQLFLVIDNVNWIGMVTNVLAGEVNNSI